MSSGQDDEIRANGIWTLVNLLINPRNHIYCKVFESSTVQHLSEWGQNAETLKLVIDLMKHEDSNTRFWSLRCVCNFCLGTGI